MIMNIPPEESYMMHRRPMEMENPSSWQKRKFVYVWSCQAMRVEVSYVVIIKELVNIVFFKQLDW